MSHKDLVTLLVAIIGALALVLAAAVTVSVPLLFSIRRHAREASNQVSNDHETNLRVELDERHQQDLNWRRGLGRRLKRIDSRLGSLEGRVDVVDERTKPQIRREP